MSVESLTYTACACVHASNPDAASNTSQNGLPVRDLVVIATESMLAATSSLRVLVLPFGWVTVRLTCLPSANLGVDRPSTWSTAGRQTPLNAASALCSQ